MSERGSFVTGFIYCPDCFENAKKILAVDNVDLRGMVIPGEGEEKWGVIAGKVFGSYCGEELDKFDFKYADQLAAVLCHTLRIAVIADRDGFQHIFRVQPLAP